jgi:hypothetical protein
LTGAFDRALEAASAARDAQRKRRAPAMAGCRMQQRLPDVFESAGQLGDVNPVEPFEHHLAARLPLLDHVGANVRECGARHPGLVGKLVDEVERHVELPHGSQCLGQAADLALRLAGLRLLEAFGQHR